MIAAGATLGSYRVTGQLGAGGMGTVYTAEHQVIGRRAAVKVLHVELSRDQDTVRRFFNEARSSSLIKHAGIVDILDFGYAPDGAAYLVMELLEGESLMTRMRRQRQLPLAELVPIVRQIAAALGAAHAAGIVHRDLKPDNVFLVPDREVAGGVRVKVLDFGIAKLAGDSTYGVSQTRTGLVMGTPLYMAPEQCKGAGQVDSRADVYALGCMLFEMVTGQVPFIAEGAGEVMAAHIHVQPTWPRMIDPSIPPALESTILRALQKRPDQRQQSMEDLAAEVERVMPGASAGTYSSPALPIGIAQTLATPPPYGPSAHGSAAGPGGGGAPAFTPQPPFAYSPTTASVRPRRRGMWLAVGAAVVGVVALIVVLARGPGGAGGSGASAAPGKSDNPVVTDHLREAESDQAEGDIDGALEHIEAAYDLSHDPALLLRAGQLAQDSDVGRALVLYRRYLGVLPSSQHNGSGAQKARNAISILSAVREQRDGTDYVPPSAKPRDRPQMRSF